MVYHVPAESGLIQNKIVISKEFIIRENPQLFVLPKNQFGLKNESTNSILARRILKNPDKIFMFTLGTGINGYRVSNRFLVINEVVPCILYYLSWYDKYFEFLQAKVSIVKLHWKDKTKFIPLFDTQKIFFDYLLPISNAIMSSRLHTNDSKQFWLKLCEKALYSNKLVYYVDFLQNNFDNNRTIRKISDIEELLTFSKEIEVWGESNKFQARRLVISNELLI